MPVHYKVKQGDCISVIAYKFGFFPETIVSHSNNSKLRELRNEMEILCQDDEIFIPEKKQRTENCNTDQRHRFCRKGVPAILHIQLLDLDLEPRAYLKVMLSVEEKSKWITTDDKGWIQEPILPNAKKAIITIPEDEENIEYEFFLGGVDPITELTGVQQRLVNLGFYSGPVDGKLTEETQNSLELFQRRYELEETREPDERTLNKLETVHNY